MLCVLFFLQQGLFCCNTLTCAVRTGITCFDRSVVYPCDDHNIRISFVARFENTGILKYGKAPLQKFEYDDVIPSDQKLDLAIWDSSATEI